MPNDTAVTIRLPKALAERVEELAQYHGRSTPEEWRLFAAYADTVSTAEYLQTPQAEAELGDRVGEARAKVKDDLRRLHRAVFKPPTPPLAPGDPMLN
jgi:predicted transcriptional regulator